MEDLLAIWRDIHAQQRRAPPANGQNLPCMRSILIAGNSDVRVISDSSTSKVHRQDSRAANWGGAVYRPGQNLTRVNSHAVCLPQGCMYATSRHKTHCHMGLTLAGQLNTLAHSPRAGTHMKGFLINAWHYRQFILSSIRTDVRTRFARSALGGVWMVLHPLAQVAVFALVLSGVFAARLGGLEGPFAYAMYLTAGTMGWTLFAELVTRGQNLFIDNGNLLKKIAFPKICLPLILSGSALVNAAALASAALAFYLVIGEWPGLRVLWLIPLYGVVVALGLGLGLLLGVLNVFIRDIGQVTPILLQFWFWFTPIVYVSSILPAKLGAMMQWNPMFHVASGFQAVLVFDRTPDPYGLAAVGLLGVGLMGAALWCLRAAGEEMADVL